MKIVKKSSLRYGRIMSLKVRIMPHAGKLANGRRHQAGDFRRTSSIRFDASLCDILRGNCRVHVNSATRFFAGALGCAGVFNFVTSGAAAF